MIWLSSFAAVIGWLSFVCSGCCLSLSRVVLLLFVDRLYSKTGAQHVAYQLLHNLLQEPIVFAALEQIDAEALKHIITRLLWIIAPLQGFLCQLLKLVDPGFG